MNSYRFLKSGVLVIVLSVIGFLPVYADRDDDDDDDDRYERHDRHERYERHGEHKYSKKDFRVDRRYRHDRRYPRRGYSVNKLPRRHHPIRYHDRDYYYFGGVWYRSSGVRFVVTMPPVGIVVPILPAFYTTIWVGGMPYYYANDVYYVWRPDLNGYKVSNPPLAADDPEPPVMADELFVYPKQGQSEQQQADDRYACHRWSVSQTDYDPSLPPKGISISQLGQKREDYQRAMKACLEGRGYSVR